MKMRDAGLGAWLRSDLNVCFRLPFFVFIVRNGLRLI